MLNPCYPPKDRRSNSRRQPTVRNETFKTWTTSFIATDSFQVCSLGTVAFYKRVYTMGKGNLTMKKGAPCALQTLDSPRNQGMDLDFPCAQLQPQISQILPDLVLLLQNQGCQFLTLRQGMLIEREGSQFFPCTRSFEDRKRQALILESLS